MKYLPLIVGLLVFTPVVDAQTKTWDGKYDTTQIEVTMVYFVPADRKPLPDWRERVNYFCRRIERFHAREFQGQSELRTIVHPAPLISQAATSELRRGDADAIYFRTLQEADQRLKFGKDERTAFPILLVLSDINWRPLDDFYRLKPQNDEFVFEGNYNRGGHFPGAASGGARAAYLSDRGVGWGLVSADGWRVPYRGSDCVIYHEGCGHTVGLPHPEPGDGSVMSQGQYRGWLSESWLDETQKKRLGWKPAPEQATAQLTLFSRFRAPPQPTEPRPGQPVILTLDWPENSKVKALRVRFQTSIGGPWVEVAQAWKSDAPEAAVLGTFDRETPVSYRVNAELEDGATAELWGYFQVRSDPQRNPQPPFPSPDLAVQSPAFASLVVSEESSRNEVDLRELADPTACWSAGDWSKDPGGLVSPKRYGARLEIPFSPPEEYRLTVIVEPLDDPNGLILGQRAGESRFVTLFNYAVSGKGMSAIENIDGKNVGNETTFTGQLFQKNRLSQVIVAVSKDRVTMSVDGRTIVAWRGSSQRLSLSDYWETPNNAAIFIGTYDCRYRFHRITLETLSGEGKRLADEARKADQP